MKIRLVGNGKQMAWMLCAVWTALHAAALAAPDSGQFPEIVDLGNGDSALWLAIPDAVSPGEPQIADLLLEPAPGQTETALLSFHDMTPEEQNAARDRLKGKFRPQRLGYLRFWPLGSISAPRDSLMLRSLSYRVKAARLTYSAADGAENPFAADSGGDSAMERARLDRDWGFGEMMRRLAANPADIERAIVAAPPPNSALPLVDWSPGDLPPGQARFRFMVENSGPIAIRPNHLANAKIDPRAANPARIRVVSRGAEIPLARFDDGDEAFEPGECVYFYAFGSDSHYSTQRAYWVVVGAEEPPPPMPRLAPPPSAADMPARAWHMARAGIEEDNIRQQHTGDFLEISDVQWVWAPVAGDRETTFTFDLPDMALDPAGAPDEVEVEFFFYHWRQEQLGANYLPASMRKCRIEINGYAAHEISFAGGDDERKTIAISRSLLKSSGNFVGMRLRSAQDGSSLDRLAEGTYFDRLTVEYPRAPMAQDGEAALIVHEDDLQTSDTFAIGGFGAETPLAIFDVSDPEAPALLEPAGRAPDALQVFLPAGAKRQIRAVEIARIASAPALVPASTADWRAADRQADYLIISHPDFIDLLEPLAEKRRQQGMLAEIVDVFDLYDGFSHGEPTPYAIKRFLLHALLHWKIPPTYVLLVGDSTSDYRGLMREPVQNWTPTYRPETTPRFEAQWASDHWFATLLGDDEYPDVLVGRLSTNSREDAREAIRKALAAAEGLPPGPWRNRALLVADNEIEFPEACETVRLKDLPPWVFVDRVYMDEMPWERNFYLEQSDVAAEDMKVSSHATQRIVDAFKEGVGFIGFFGHGSPNIWTDERIWFGGDSPNSDNLLLRNGDRMPFVAAWTCNNGAIDYPAPRWNVCIAEDMMRVRQGGSHGIFAPTGPGGTESHSRLSSQLIRALYREGPARQGDAIALAKTRALLVPGLNDYARMYLLLGDPAAPFLCPRNQLDISVEPYYAAQSQKSLRVSARNAPAPQGRIVFRLANPSGEGREDIQAYDFSQDKPDYLLPLPGALERGEWRLQAYFWDEASGLDAAGHAPFVVETPFAELESFSADTDRADGKTALALNLKNPSLAPIQGLKFDVREKQGYRLAVVCSGQEDLAPGESKTWEHFWEAPPGAHELSARLLNFDGSPLADRAPAAKREISFSIPAPADSPRFALSAYDLRQEFRRVEADAEMEASVSVLLTAGEWSGPLEVGWGWADEIASTATVAFSADNRAKSTAAKFYLTAPLADLPKPFFLEIDPFRKVLSADEPPVRLHSRMDAKALPNLVFSREGVATDPASPSDGQTVFFHVGVKNEGQASAGRFRVAAYGSDPNQGGEPLPNRAGAPHWECEGLAPNAETKALIRWDPGQNAGEHRIYFWIDSQNRIMESDENDNLRYFPLRVRTLADLKPQAVTFDTPPSELGRLRLHVNASVRNDGETEARNVMFQFYSDREGNPENKLGEPRLVPVIKPGETHTETYVWQLPPTFREDLEKPDFSISACAQVYLKGSLQRVVVAHRSYLEND